MRLLIFALFVFLTAPVRAAPIVATVEVKAKVLKPLTLRSTQNLDLGTIVLQSGTWSGATVTLSRSGVLSCSAAQLACSGATRTAKYQVTGSNNETVLINAPNVMLRNQTDPSKSLTMVIDSPGTITLSNSGNQGQEFSLGGSITLDSSTSGGFYVGTFNVTVEYR